MATWIVLRFGLEDKLLVNDDWAFALFKSPSQENSSLLRTLVRWLSYRRSQYVSINCLELSPSMLKSMFQPHDSTTRGELQVHFESRCSFELFGIGQEARADTKILRESTGTAGALRGRSLEPPRTFAVAKDAQDKNCRSTASNKQIGELLAFKACCPRLQPHVQPSTMPCGLLHQSRSDVAPGDIPWKAADVEVISNFSVRKICSTTTAVPAHAISLHSL